MNYLPKSRTENIVIQETITELLIYDLISNKAMCLNETSKIVWQACDGKTTFDEFRRKTNSEFSDELIWLALEQFKHDDLLDKSVAIEPTFNSLTRRQVVRKVGFATMFALPMIVSIVAPSAAMAQSGSTLLANRFFPCTANSQCQSNSCQPLAMYCCNPGVADFGLGPNEMRFSAPASQILQICCNQTGIFVLDPPPNSLQLGPITCT